MQTIPKNCNCCSSYDSHVCLFHKCRVGNCDTCIDWSAPAGVYNHYEMPIFIDWDINVRSFECQLEEEDVETARTVTYGYSTAGVSLRTSM